MVKTCLTRKRKREENDIVFLPFAFSYTPTPPPCCKAIRLSIEKAVAFQCKAIAFPVQSHRLFNGKPKPLPATPLPSLFLNIS